MLQDHQRTPASGLFVGRALRFLCILFLLFGAAVCVSDHVLDVPLLTSTAFAQGDEEVGVVDDADAAEAADAGEDAGEPANTDRRKQAYLTYLVVALGPVFAPVFLILSVSAVALVVINILAIRRPVLMPQALVDQFTTLLDEKKFQEAYEVAKESDSFIGKVLAAGLAKISSGYDTSQKAMQDVGEEELMRLEHRLAFLALLANVAPMIGLLGTVVGMVQAFQVIATSQTAPQASKLAEGISTALVTTEFGLFIAIPCIMCYDILKNMMARMVLEISFLTENLMSRFKTEKSE